MTEAPPRVVRTRRLTLRPFEARDEPAYAAIRARPEVARFLPGGEAEAARGAEKAAALVPAFAALWDDPGYGPWAVEERATGRLLGHLGLRRLDDLGGRTELLYALDPAAQGRGYATEGGRAALAHAFGPLALPEVIALALPANAPSLAVMGRLGMVREPGLVQAFGLDLVLASIDAARWAALATETDA